MGAVPLASPRLRSGAQQTVDAARLQRRLRERVRGQVCFDDGSRALYATDASNYRQVPIGVVLPCDPDDAAAAVEVCHQFGAPVLSRGGGTSVSDYLCLPERVGRSGWWRGRVVPGP